MIERIGSKKKILEILKSNTTPVNESIEIPLKSMVNIANQTIQNYLENLDESTKKKVFHILASRPEDLEKEFFEIKESTVSKLENLLEKESEDDMKQKLVETIQKIKAENYEQVNYIRLKQLEESISQTDS